MDTQATEFTVAGIGDMSGDVFGNGMLLSEHILLVAAFDHRHIFLDPAPDAAASFAERQRMFALPRSSWADYDGALISAGGGVWPRTAKSVPVSPQASQVLGLGQAVHAMPPDQLISAILAAPVDLLWNGGIGTYVKASNQTHTDAGDRANDAVRIDAAQLRAKVVAEGGNLGLTQAARIEFALAGGLVNTDFIDNSAGVDTSDHEVNIKILLQAKVDRGELTAAARGELLHAMTDEVATLVLRQNYDQNRALAAAGAQAAQMLHVHSRYLRRLEREHRIGRRLDSLPGDKEIAERRSAGLGLTVPEFAVLLAQAKISAVQQVLDSAVPDDKFLRSVLTSYFPEPLQDAYAAEMDRHPLRREIVTTIVVNDMVNTGGTTFLFRMNEETGASVPDISRAWLVAREVYGMRRFWAQVEGLDGQVSVATQIGLMLEGRKLTERAVRWLLQNRRPPFDIQATIGFFADGVHVVGAILPSLLTGRDLATFTERQEAAIAREVPGELAGQVAAMVPAYSAFDIVDVAADTGSDVDRDRGHLLQPRRPPADRPAQGPDRRAAQGRPLEHHGARRPAGRSVRRARRARLRGAEGHRPGHRGRTAGRMVEAERGRRAADHADPDRDLGDRAVHAGDVVGGGPCRPEPRGVWCASGTFLSPADAAGADRPAISASSRRLSAMTGTDPATELSELSSKLSNVEAVLNPGAMEREADKLKEQAADPGLWADTGPGPGGHQAALLPGG